MLIEYKTIDLYGKPLFSRVALQTPVSSTAPMPEEEACFTYVLEGENISFSEAEAVHISARQAMLSKCGNYVAKLLSTETGGVFRSLTVHFHKTVLEKVYRDSVPGFLKTTDQQVRYNSAQVAVSDLIKRYFEGVMHLFEHPELAKEELLQLKLKEIIHLLCETEDAPHVREIMSQLFNKRIFTFKEVIEAHICSPLTIEELAGLTNRSLSAFKKEFFNVYQETPGRYLVRRRAEKVAALLPVSDDSISEIAYRCGFKSLSHMTHVFKKRFGVTPSAFRHNHRHKG